MISAIKCIISYVLYKIAPGELSSLNLKGAIVMSEQKKNKQNQQENKKNEKQNEKKNSENQKDFNLN